MLRVRTRLGRSEIDGLGLFADEDIEKDQIIYEHVEAFEQTFTPDQVNALAPLQQDFLKHYSFKRSGLRVVSIDDDRFINHSTDPNTYESGMDTYARRLIRRGEEITANYFDFDESAAEKVPSP